MVQIQTPHVDARKREILHAAAKLFREKGFGPTGMREIAAACGMTASNLYYYFASKDELLAFCQEVALVRLNALAESVRSQADWEPDVQLYALVVGHVVCLNETFPGSLAHMQVEDLPTEWRARITAGRDEYECTWRSIVGEGLECGVFAETDAKWATLALLGAVNWTVKWYRPDGGAAPRVVGEQFARTLVRGLLRDPQSWEPPTLSDSWEFLGSTPLSEESGESGS
ncbi:MAG: TetR/AcrR family transcriptional regulator [Planctomycetota bacterium]